MADTATQVIRAARSKVGYHEGCSGGHWNNKEIFASEVPGLDWVNAGGYPWCAVFVCWAFNKVGALDLIPGGPTASVAHFRDAAKAAGRFSEYPARGAIILYGENGDAHTGVVVSFDDTNVVTVEGNTNTDGSAEGDGVYRKVHQRTDPWVYGYVYPTYPEGIDSADPAWQASERVAPAQKPPKSPSHRKSKSRTRGAEGNGLVRQARRLLGRAWRRAKNRFRRRNIRAGLHRLPKK